MRYIYINFSLFVFYHYRVDGLEKYNVCTLPDEFNKKVPKIKNINTKGRRTNTQATGDHPAPQIKSKTHVQKITYIIFKTNMVTVIVLLQLIFPAQYTCSEPTF